MNRKEIGDLGVAQAIAYYTANGYVVCYPLTDSARFDLVIVGKVSGLSYRVQVKTTTVLSKHGIAVASLSTQGGNRSWDGSTIKYITEDECDLVFVYSTRTQNKYQFPVKLCAGHRTVNLGKDKAAYLL